MGVTCPVPPGTCAEAAAVPRGRACGWTPRATWWWTSSRTPPGEGSMLSGMSAGEPSSPQVPRPRCPPLPSAGVPRRAAAQALRPSPQWPSRPAESWRTGSSRASGTPGWTTGTSPPSSSATRPSAPWASPKVATGRARRGAEGLGTGTWRLRAAGVTLEGTIWSPAGALSLDNGLLSPPLYPARLRAPSP